MIRTKTELVNTIGQLRLSCMSGSGKKVSVQVCIPERAQWIDYQGIRIQVQDPVYMAGEKMGSQQAVIPVHEQDGTVGTEPDDGFVQRRTQESGSGKRKSQESDTVLRQVSGFFPESGCAGDKALQRYPSDLRQWK